MNSKPEEATLELRARVLAGAPGDFGLEPDGAVWGVLMETGYPQGSATLVALVDGSASLYFSTGGGIIGGAHAGVNAAARNLVRLAADELSAFSPAADTPLPAEGRVVFYVLTTGGVVAAETTEESLGEGAHPLSSLFFAGHDVITGLRQIDESA